MWRVVTKVIERVFACLGVRLVAWAVNRALRAVTAAKQASEVT